MGSINPAFEGKSLFDRELDEDYPLAGSSDLIRSYLRFTPDARKTAEGFCEVGSLIVENDFLKIAPFSSDRILTSGGALYLGENPDDHTTFISLASRASTFCLIYDAYRNFHEQADPLPYHSEDEDTFQRAKRQGIKLLSEFFIKVAEIDPLILAGEHFWDHQVWVMDNGLHRSDTSDYY